MDDPPPLNLFHRVASNPDTLCPSQGVTICQSFATEAAFRRPSEPNTNTHDRSPSRRRSSEMPTGMALVVGRPTNGSRCAIPLLPIFIVPVLILTAIVGTSIWMTTNIVATRTVNDVSNRLHQFVKLQLEAKIHSLLLEMSLAARYSTAFIGDEPDFDRIERVLQISLSTIREPLYLMYSTVGGYAVGANRWSTGATVVGQRPNGTTNLTFYFAGPHNQRGAYLGSIVYNPFDRPWFVAVATHSFQPTFTQPYPHVPEPFMGVSLGMPVYNSMGVLQGVFAVDYSLKSIETALKTAYETLNTAGILLLVDSSGGVIAVAGKYADNKVAVAALTQSMLAATVGSTGQTVKRDMPYLGSVFVVSMEVDGQVDTDFFAQGLSWKLLVAIPESTYYGSLWRNNNVNAAILAVWAVVFVILSVIMSQVFFSIPLRKLRKRLEHLKESAHNLDYVSMVEAEEKTSIFREIQALQLAAVDAVIAVEEVSRLRNHEAAQAAEAERAKEHAEELMRSREMFFAMMSHEMRTPLTACIGMAQILLETTTLDQRQRECAQAIEGSGSTLLTLINDLLDLSKMEADKITLEEAPYSVRECVEQSISIVQSKADEKGLELIAFISSHIPRTMLGDKCRLRQILLNLLSNGIKFTPKGSVVLKCEMVNEGTAVRFDVADTGIGLSRSTIPRLFQPFTQADSSTFRRFGGTGLGLSISKRLVEMMGGELQVSSEGEGHGARFWFDLPCTAEYLVPRPHSPLGSCVSLPYNLRVLVVDRFLPRRDALCEVLKSLAIPFDPVEDASHISERYGSDTIVIMVKTGTGRVFVDQVRGLQRACGLSESPLAKRVIVISRMKELADTKIDANSLNCIWLTQPVTLEKLRTAILDASRNTLLPTSASTSMVHSVVLPKTQEQLQSSSILVVDATAFQSNGSAKQESGKWQKCKMTSKPKA